MTSRLPPDTDELLARVGRGDGAARGQVLDRHRGRLRRMVSVASSWNWIGRHRAKAKRYSDAEAAFGELLNLLDRLAAEFPHRPDYPGSGGDTLANLSLMARDRGDKVEGRRVWEKAKKKYNTALELDANEDRYREKIRREFGSATEPPLEVPDG